MKVKAVIWREDRTNDVKVVKKKDISGRTFEFDKTTYFLDPDASQITWTRPNKYLGIVREYFTTFYYFRGVSTPVPISQWTETIIKSRNPGKNGNGLHNPEEMEALKGKPGAKPVLYKDVVDLGIPAEELAAIFNPWFYRQIAAKSRDAWEQIQFYATIGCVLGLVWIIYMLSTGNYELPPPPEPAAPAGGIQP